MDKLRHLSLASLEISSDRYASPVLVILLAPNSSDNPVILGTNENNFASDYTPASPSFVP